MKANVVLPETFLRCVKPEDRAKLRAGMTAEEFMAKGAAKNEKDLQQQVVQLLRLKGIEPLVPAFGKKTRMAIGWPDLTFAVKGTAVCWEVKHGKGLLSQEQKQMAVRLMSTPNEWRWDCIRSVDEALEVLREMGL